MRHVLDALCVRVLSQHFILQTFPKVSAHLAQDLTRLKVSNGDIMSFCLLNCNSKGMKLDVQMGHLLACMFQKCDPTKFAAFPNCSVMISLLCMSTFSQRLQSCTQLCTQHWLNALGYHGFAHGSFMNFMSNPWISGALGGFALLGPGRNLIKVMIHEKESAERVNGRSRDRVT